MKLIQEKKVNINGVEYPIKLTLRALIDFQNMTGHSITVIDPDNMNDIASLSYLSFKAGGSKLTYDEFIDLIGEDILALKSFAELLLEKTEKKQKVR